MPQAAALVPPFTPKPEHRRNFMRDAMNELLAREIEGRWRALGYQRARVWALHSGGAQPPEIRSNLINGVPPR